MGTTANSCSIQQQSDRCQITERASESTPERTLPIGQGYNEGVRREIAQLPGLHDVHIQTSLLKGHCCYGRRDKPG